MSLQDLPFKTRETYYFLCLGRFVHAYSRVEATIHRLFRHCTGLDAASARAISGGMRLSDIQSMINRVAKARALRSDVRQEIERVFTQLNEVSKLRDALVHRGIEPGTHGLISTSFHTAKTVEEADAKTLYPGEIIAATEDCHRIVLRIAHIYAPPSHSAPSKVLTEPWSYRHRGPNTASRLRRASARLLRRQPSA